MSSITTDGALAHADELVQQGRLLEAIDALRAANRAASDPTLERRLVGVRSHSAVATR